MNQIKIAVFAYIKQNCAIFKKMSNWLRFILAASIITVIFSNCILKEEPEIPVGETNEKVPMFLSAQIIAVTNDSVFAMARLKNLGNLKILNHGWVWAGHPNPTFQDNLVPLGLLAIDSFATSIKGFSYGKTYYFCPFVLTGQGIVYGPTDSLFMGIPIVDDIPISPFVNNFCRINLQVKLQSVAPVLEYGLVVANGTDNLPTLQNNTQIIPGEELENGVFRVQINNLEPDMTFLVSAYARNTYGVGYSPVAVLGGSPSLYWEPAFSINTDAEVFKGATVQLTNITDTLGVFSGFHFVWDFGDGSMSNEISPIHTFNQLGNHNVSLTAEIGGCIKSTQMLIKVVEDPFQDYWVSLPGGIFIMGCTVGQEPDCSADAYPEHQVFLSPFIIGKTEVTQGQWKAVTGNNPSHFYLCGADCPVERVSWERINTQFLPKLYRKTGRLYRLPTEAEWEYAARGGKDTKYSGSDILSMVGWFDNNGSAISATNRVAQKQPNDFGLFDMSGNVSEWCNDWYAESYYNPILITNPIGPATGDERVTRGGAFQEYSFEYADIKKCRVSHRAFETPDFLNKSVGFRLVKN